jgi:hypothetical protein
MNLQYIEDKIRDILTKDNDNIRVAIKFLLKEVMEEKKIKERMTQDLSVILSVVDEYNTTYLSLVDKFHAVDLNKIDEKTKLAQEILCVLTAMHVYLTDIISKYSTNLTEKSKMYKYIKALIDRKENCVSDKFAWGTILKSLTTSTNKKIELIKYRMSLQEK